MRKELSVATDILDNILCAKRHFTKQDIEHLMAYCASMGATRHEWIVDTLWTLYDDNSPVGYDLLAEACDAAHRHGMRFDAIYKPFEGALDHPMFSFPSTFPRPEGGPFLDVLDAIVGAVRPFLAAHPEMRMARRADDAIDPGGRIAAIRLIKDDDGPCPFDPKDLAVWVSPHNGGFHRYTGPFAVSTAVERRLFSPHQLGACRIITFGELHLPEDTRFILISCAGTCHDGDFKNDVAHIIEILNERGQLIPSTPSRWRTNIAERYCRESVLNRLQMTRYTRLPVVTGCLQDQEQFLREAEGMYFFGFDGTRGEVSLCRDKEVALARGKDRYSGGILCPVYPEVRQHWLDEIRYCLDRGVDGVGVRPTSHSWAAEPWAFGFNEPVLARCEHPGDIAEARRANGEAYGQFIREASALVRGRGKEFGYILPISHLCGQDRSPERNLDLIRNIDWQWENLVRDAADYVELRGWNLLRWENAREVLDRVGLVASEAGIPLIFPGAVARHDCELQMFMEHPNIAVYQLYESAFFTKIKEDGTFEGDADVTERIRRYWKENGWS